ncbi:hypothetical protein WKI71_45725 [Streptomyces sp. MS1.AVA.1]|uniref:Tetratricopeptide repeat protein n=1 Tax=Streptomyces machairae TaxID=3134109 RepID=A0ABU8UVY7_9ACTN
MQAAAEHDLGVALWRRFFFNRQQADLDEAVTALRRAVALTPAGAADYPVCVSGLAVALRTRFEHARVRRDLDEAVTLSHTAATLDPSHPRMPILQSNLGQVLQTLFDHTAAPEDLAQAEAASRAALAATPPDDPERPEMLRILSATLCRQFELHGDRKTLDEAIIGARESARLASAVNPAAQLTALVQLASQLHRRYDLTHSPEDLDHAIDAERQTMADPRDPDRPGRLSNLSASLQARFELLDHIEDLDEAVEKAREAVATLPAVYDDRTTVLHRLATTLFARYLHSRQPTDLNEAIVAGADAVQAGTEDAAGQADLHIRLEFHAAGPFRAFGRSGRH